ncbi:Ricin-type beta-trefoil lectin domain-like [Paenibacillaceae bacterium GAS479]|nr:Ricin-type beta-trefoil lectin domain-like [Paenibacillaceae bacterium GAS479]
MLLSQRIIPRKLLTAMLALALVLTTFGFAPSVKAAPAAIVNNTNWFDTDGNQIWAQGGWVMQEGNTFYWYGVDYSVANQKKVNLYTSTDMATWDYQGNVVDFSGFVDASGGYSGNDWLGRPVVAYNSVNNNYVMIIEWNNSVGTIRKGLTYLTSSSPTGPFIFNNNDPLPTGNTVGDLGSIFKDTNGKTYISMTVDYPGTNGSLRIAELAPDYLSVASTVKTIGATYPNKEASTLIKVGSTYWMFASATNGWGSSQTYCMSATSLSGTWSAQNVCATNPATTNSYDTQTDQILPIQGSSGTLYVYLGDRWNNMSGGSTGVGRNQWHPVSFGPNGNPNINGNGSWSIDTVAGTWSPINTTIDLTKTYSITNQNSGKALGITGNSTADGAAAVQNTFSNAAGQTWKFYDAGGGYYKIQNVNSGKYLNIYGAATADGAAAIQYASTTSINQHWQIVPVSGGGFKLINRNSGKVLGINGESTAEGAAVVQSPDSTAMNQRWSFSALD